MLLITDRIGEARPLQQVLQRVQPCEVMALSPSHLPGRSHGLIVCDVALDRPGSVAALQAALVCHRQGTTTPVLVLLRDPSHVTRGQARLAGATATLEQPVPTDRLLATLNELMGAAPGGRAPMDEARQTAIGAMEAGKILAMIFHAAGTRQPISVDGLNQGGEVLLGVLRQARIQTWLSVVWKYDDATYQHCLLVAGLAAAFALELGLSPKAQNILSQAALVHDIGKAQVPRHILNKAGQLSPAEMTVMRSHAAAGHRMLAKQPGLDPILLDVTRHHHEYLDGSGYPDGLRDAAISRVTRIVTVCDIYAALVENRVYKKPLAPQAALEHLDRLGPKIDQALVKAFRNVMRDT